MCRAWGEVITDKRCPYLSGQYREWDCQESFKNSISIIIIKTVLVLCSAAPCIVALHYEKVKPMPYHFIRLIN